ncbi:hypothetical protein EYF80_006574 [Liparis tanakae]|uniref:Uncharacterized protein n=1 Tax=Liparis tanakae TaxID=230148 RepID=A0A4Z2IZW7_9TELE|nr:hypothetical protein EYF80_006574 [Liparis tanakae]
MAQNCDRGEVSLLHTDCEALTSENKREISRFDSKTKSIQTYHLSANTTSVQISPTQHQYHQPQKAVTASRHEGDET